MIHNGSKTTIMNWQQNNYMIGGHHNMSSCMKGLKRLEGWEPMLSMIIQLNLRSLDKPLVVVKHVLTCMFGQTANWVWTQLENEFLAFMVLTLCTDIKSMHFCSSWWQQVLPERLIGGISCLLRHIKARKEALLVEKERSAKVARLPPPVPAPFEVNCLELCLNKF